MNRSVQKLAVAAALALTLGGCGVPGLEHMESELARKEDALTLQQQEQQALQQELDAARAELAELYTLLMDRELLLMQSGALDEGYLGEATDSQQAQSGIGETLYSQVADYLEQAYPEDFIHEQWGATVNVERLDRFVDNCQAGVSDLVFIRQDGNPTFRLYMMFYPGEGSSYLVRTLYLGAARTDTFGAISLIDGYYYFTEGPVRLEDGIIHYQKGANLVSVPFDTFPFSAGQPLKLGREGSGWVHP